MEFLCEKISTSLATVVIVGQTMKCKFVKCAQPRLEMEREAKGFVMIALLKLRRNKWTDCWAIINRPPLGLLLQSKGGLFMLCCIGFFSVVSLFPHTFYTPFVHLFGRQMHGDTWRYIFVRNPKVLVPQGFIGVLWIYMELWKKAAEQRYHISMYLHKCR